MSRGPHAISADFVFDGDVVHGDSAIVIDDGRVAAVVPRAELLAEVPVHAAPSGAWLAPGFIDVQVNGGGDVLFNDAPTPATIACMVAAHRRFGTTSLLPTLISDTREKMQAALQAVAEAAATEPGVLGIHLEGPFLSPEKVGAHDPSMLRTPTTEDVEMLTACAWRSAIRWRPTRKPGAHCRKVRGASRTCSMPCVRWAAASPVRSRQLSNLRTSFLE
jgi:N-acetylglucosamine-6-phosphate deacetylase